MDSGTRRSSTPFIPSQRTIGKNLAMVPLINSSPYYHIASILILIPPTSTSLAKADESLDSLPFNPLKAWAKFHEANYLFELGSSLIRKGIRTLFLQSGSAVQGSKNRRE